jgi:hypothetical protein
MTTFDYSGTYMTSWLQPDGKTYVPGPVVVDMSTQSVTLNGVVVNSPKFDTTTNTVAWDAFVSSAGVTMLANSSSASLNFYQNSGVNGFAGVFAQGTDPLPATNNLFGSASAAQKSLANWAATYNVFLTPSTSSAGTMVVNGTSVTYLGSAVSNYAYTGEVPPGMSVIDQLAWFTTGGNKQNMILQFGKDSSGELTFYGMFWTGGNQPASINVTGTTASTPTPPTISVALLALVTSSAATTEVVEVEVIAAVGGMAGSAGSLIAASPADDARAADDLVDKATLLSGGT